MIKIFAYDPGHTTGYALIDVNEKGDDFQLLECDEIQWEERMLCLQRELAVVAQWNDIVVVETFRLFPHKALAQIGSQFPSSQVIGNIEAFMYIANLTNIKFQTPGDISRVQVLERDLGMVAGSPHKIDAYRHARLAFIRHFQLNPFS